MTAQFASFRLVLGSFSLLPAVAFLLLASLLLPSNTSAQVAGLCSASVRGGALTSDCFGSLVVDGELDLDGHIVLGSVVCGSGSCRVHSSSAKGRIVGDGAAGTVGVRADGNVELANVSISGFGTGVEAEYVQAVNVDVGGSKSDGVIGREGIIVSGGSFSGNGASGLRSPQGAVDVIETNVNGNGSNGIYSLEGVVVADSTITNNRGSGIVNFSKAAMISGSEVTGNGVHGIRTDDSDCDPTGPFVVTDSNVSGNAKAVSCRQGAACADLVACNLPQLQGSAICGTSAGMVDRGDTAPWGVCSDD